MWLQTSPEFAMKRLLAAGATAIYQITRAFRAAEAGQRHNPEFTIVEWYRRGDTMSEGMQLLSDLAEALLGLGPAEPISYGEAFARYVGVDPHRAAVDELAHAAERHSISPSQSFAGADRDEWLNLLLAHLVEPHLGVGRPTILYDYPAGQTGAGPGRRAIRRWPSGSSCTCAASNWRMVITNSSIRQSCGVETARPMTSRTADGKPRLDEESRLLAAMDHGLCACTGAALGFDRLVMLAAGASSLAEVIAFPIDRA